MANQKVKNRFLSQRCFIRAFIGCTIMASLVAPAISQESKPFDPYAGMTPVESKRLDVIVAAEAPLGSDAWHTEKLRQSPRHRETITLAAEGRNRQALVVSPTTKEPVPVVLMIPEDQGLNNWAADMADQIAAMGYIVIVPDFLSGRGPNGGGRSSFPDIKSAMYNLIHIKEADLTADTNAWADYGNHLTGSNHKLAVVGFGWGGGRAFWWATQRHDLTAAFIFYDTAPPASALAGLNAPVYAFYADHDARVTRQLETIKTNMQAAGKKYDSVLYPGSDHMFVRLGDEPGNINPANLEARSAALARLQELLASM